jgi:hypothetical protein
MADTPDLRQAVAAAMAKAAGSKAFREPGREWDHMRSVWLGHADAALAALGLDHPAGGPHRYLSTGCLHGEHGYCQSSTGLAGAKTPARCKFCKAPCLCPCHTPTPETNS